MEGDISHDNAASASILRQTQRWKEEAQAESEKCVHCGRMHVKWCVQVTLSGLLVAQAHVGLSAAL